MPSRYYGKYSKLFLEISELVARMNLTEAKAGAALEAQMGQFASHHDLKTTVLRGFESDLVIDAADNSIFVTRKANLISVIHEHSRRNSNNATVLDDSSASLLLEASWQKQLAQQQIQIGSLQYQLEEQIAHVRMAAGNVACNTCVIVIQSYVTSRFSEKELQKRTALIAQKAEAETTAAQACMMQALKEVEKMFEIIERPVSLTSTEMSCSDCALLISEVMSECNRMIHAKLLSCSNNAKPELELLAGLDDQVRKHVTADSDVGKLFAAAIENARASHLTSLSDCAQQQRRHWVKLVKALRAEFTGMAELVESTLPEKAVKAVRQIVLENNRRLCCAIDFSELPATPLKLNKSTKIASKPSSKFEAVVPVSPTRLSASGRPGSAYSVGRSKDNSYARAFARQLDDSRQGQLVRGPFQ